MQLLGINRLGLLGGLGLCKDVCVASGQWEMDLTAGWPAADHIADPSPAGEGGRYNDIYQTGAMASASSVTDMQVQRAGNVMLFENMHLPRH